MATSKDIGWETCAEGDCIGVRLLRGGKCWAHADDQDLDAALKRLGEDGLLDACGVPITQELLRRLLAAAHQDNHGHAILADPPCGFQPSNTHPDPFGIIRLSYIRPAQRG